MQPSVRWVTEHHVFTGEVVHAGTSDHNAAVLYRARYSATRDACDNMAHSAIFVCDVLHGDRVRRMISSGVRKKLR